MKKKWILLLSLATIVTSLALYVFLSQTSANPSHLPHLPPGNVKVPTSRTLHWTDRSDLTDELLEYWAKKSLNNWQTRGKIDEPRTLLARFLLKRELDATNNYLRTLEPWGNAGSVWPLHKKGDYDFTMAGLIPILFLFGDHPDILSPEARENLLNTLLPLEGGEPNVTVPNTLGLVRDTENHLLMTEGSRYLKNRWLALHGSNEQAHDNIANGLEEWLLELLQEMQSTGLYEFNSVPYEGYTLIALLNLDSHGSEKIQAAARNFLDNLNWRYALGSLNYNRFPPFRRRYSHADDTALDEDRHGALIKTWMSLAENQSEKITLTGNQHIALWACFSSYRLPDVTAQRIREIDSGYLVQMGHGTNATPEIYSAGSGWLLTAGGVHRGERSLIVARPITLILDDGSSDLSEILHLSGPTDDFRKWNNTGVWNRFAVTAGPVQIPKPWKADAESQHWKVYNKDKICIAVHSRKNIGLVHIVKSQDAQSALEAILQANPSPEALLHTFHAPDGAKIEYELTADKSEWLIKTINDRATERTFDEWPLLQSAFGIDTIDRIQ